MYKKKTNTMDVKSVFISSLMAGGVAGTVVDISLFPLDTIKTRLQSKQGFLKAGGFSGLYKGIFPVLIGSAPTAALFFVTYEGIKSLTEPKLPQNYHSLLHMFAASLSEVAACLIRVPVEVVKQRKQALLLDKDGFNLRLFYRGYWSTVLRDMPFSLLQFPLWEYLKRIWRTNIDRDILPVESAICGSISGGISAAITTPLDVTKTRIMLASKTLQASELKIIFVLRDVYKTQGLQGLFSGIGPRVIWISIGGFIFFGAYEQAKVIIGKYLLPNVPSYKNVSNKNKEIHYVIDKVS